MMQEATAAELIEWGKKNKFLVETKGGIRLHDALMDQLRAHLPYGQGIRMGPFNLNVLNAVQSYKPRMTQEETVKALRITQGFLEMGGKTEGWHQ